MHETRRLVEAALALSSLLQNATIPHAFYGSVMTAILSNAPLCDASTFTFPSSISYTLNIFPFFRKYSALSKAVTAMPILSGELYVTFRRLIPAIDIEILPAGETGPRRLDASNTMRLQNVPFLTVSEFIRAKLKTWVIRGSERDAQDILYVFVRYWNRVDFNRITEQDMNVFVSRNAAAGPAWVALRRKYGM
ncbi:hypothetical protein D9613_008701 [Agrocybe pediades]|uniref:Uncharacterized protein n=1 Tax=Agrocybe pediades TaxID=84607 RepID=A0A8H4VN94_9AGAR|nr:hypothetical protein D9613_008701 [Agrocybe pediades]